MHTKNNIMVYNFKNLNSKEIAYSLATLVDLIDDLRIQLKERGFPIKSSKPLHDYNEYGFYIKSKEGLSDIFVGFWLDCWQSTGQAFAIVVSGEEKNQKRFNALVSEFCNVRKSEGLKYLLFNDFPTILISEQYFDNSELIKNLSKLLKELASVLGFQFGFME